MKSGTRGKNLDLGLQYVRSAVRNKKMVTSKSICRNVGVGKTTSYEILLVASLKGYVVPVGGKTGKYCSKAMKKRLQS